MRPDHPRNYSADLGGTFARLVRIETKPMAKPRMTRRDKWGKRPIVQRWNAYKDTVRLLSPPNFEFPEHDYWMVFTFALPKSESFLMIGQGHRRKPDKDNLEKGILDIYLADDSKVFDGRVTKLWGDADSIEIWWNWDGLGAG